MIPEQIDAKTSWQQMLVNISSGFLTFTGLGEAVLSHWYESIPHWEKAEGTQRKATFLFVLGKS